MNGSFPTALDHFPNGPEDRGTFIGTCRNCGIVWVFENHEAIPVPYPHGTCPGCERRPSARAAAR